MDMVVVSVPVGVMVDVALAVGVRESVAVDPGVSVRRDPLNGVGVEVGVRVCVPAAVAVPVAT